MSPFELVVAFLLVVWLILTVASQFRSSFTARLNRWDKFHLLPRYTFFAPRPGCTDYFLVYRDVDKAGRAGDWIELITPEDITAVQSLWHPRKRLSKALCDIVASLSQLGGSGAPSSVNLTLPYLIVLNRVMEQPQRLPSACAREFLIAETGGVAADVPLRALFRSEVHPFDDG